MSIARSHPLWMPEEPLFLASGSSARALMLEAAGIPFEIRKIRLDELAQADELMITSSRRLVSAVTRLDGRAVRDGCAGRVTLALFNQMRDDIAAMIASRQNAALETTHA